jgi:excisionase family DNA binding protein
MENGSERQLFTTRQAADYLGLTRASIYQYVHNGRLKRVAKEMGSNGRVQHLYAQEDVALLLRHIEEKKQNQSRIDEAIIRAARAESIARQAERSVSDLCELLGMDGQPRDLSDASLRTQHRTAARLVNSPTITTKEAIDLAVSTYHINEDQLRVLELVMHDPEPWTVYVRAVERSLLAMSDLQDPEAKACHVYLRMALQRLRTVAFEFVRQAYGHVKAEQLAEQLPDQMDEHIIRLVLTTLRSRTNATPI